ncbi:NAD(P)H-dependent oxidoreductase [Dysgonomonas sp. 511]|uniref:NAD(P)H-dependent oxidoreductase n=1 Tax=Dysgonomonas sp. 511 TaxID=2302930 RepID=UPI0013D66FEF|nr:NAD(P)H-dependent oxidoreductase [Dysgonomonas sp. 511]NDV78713.1 flavodoxin family protein [Dysgonomonas sp. 511]
MVTIVFSHPWHGSFNKAILDTVTAVYDKENVPYNVIDLHKDGFNPVFTEEELAGYSQGRAFDPLILRYQEMIKKSDEMVFIFPNWWNTMPAILKGFFDKALLKDFAFNYEGGFNPLLKIEKTTVITTSEHPSPNFANIIEKGFIGDMLNPVGIRNAVWLGCEGTSKGTDEHRREFLGKVAKHILDIRA